MAEIKDSSQVVWSETNGELTAAIQSGSITATELDNSSVQGIIDVTYIDGLEVDAGSVDGLSVVALTQAQYDALVSGSGVDANTLYFITD